MSPSEPRRRGGSTGLPGPEAPVYVISVAAELTGLHPQTLRAYDRMGLVSPGRTGGGGRRYSWRDIELLREVAELTASGIGLEGVRRILDLENHVAALQHRAQELERQLATAEYALAVSLADRGSVRNLPAVRSSAAAQSVVMWGRRHGNRSGDA
ncbi:MAG TPA: MerR family transcriptional regulator [Marmoricola sp.]|nr:MerR family transcriptional regulator [Marmoricola sp.]